MLRMLPKTIILAIATLLLAVAALVTDLVSPYAGNIDSATTVSAPPVPVRSTSPARGEIRALASRTTASTPIFDAI
ncbi:MAG: hypothetical protein GC182_07565 [Rhodopseudomonas sp.]|nr:hypothetical protein [Rhodopseudomonas sp.]